MCRVSSPNFPMGGLVMTGIQLGYRDLILQEGPAKRARAELGQARPTGVDRRGGGAGGAMMEGDFMPVEALGNSRNRNKPKG